MNVRHILYDLGILLLLLLIGQPQPVVAQARPVEPAVYTVLFESDWRAESHPHENFPANAHFSSLIGATHTLSTTLWQPGALASPGIEQMAETGGTSELRAEINALGVDALATISGSGLGSTPGSVIIPAIAVDGDHPAVTLVTMIAPSPDWFVGVHGLSLLDDEGVWLDELVITLYPYDAGSDDGPDYTSANAKADPHQPIRLLTGEAPFSEAPIGTLTFTRQHQRYLPIIVH